MQNILTICQILKVFYFTFFMFHAKKLENISSAYMASVKL